MKRISLLFSKSSLDDVLKTIQELESVQFRDLKVQDNWSEALEKDEVVFPTIQISHTSNSNHGVIEGNDALIYLMNQQQYLEATVGNREINKMGKIRNYSCAFRTIFFL
ncbi:V-type H+-ATPase, subunit I [Streptococcus pneumoniae]|nr:V-type H+-ATPase, subunit I [Streptococcus pneumoniae]